MIKILSWIIGMTTGAAVGALIVAFFVPETSADVRRRLKRGYIGALEAAKQAQDIRRAELEAQLAHMQKKRLQVPHDKI